MNSAGLFKNIHSSIKFGYELKKYHSRHFSAKDGIFDSSQNSRLLLGLLLGLFFVFVDFRLDISRLGFLFLFLAPKVVKAADGTGRVPLQQGVLLDQSLLLLGEPEMMGLKLTYTKIWPRCSLIAQLPN